jgi:hypothetical protein
MRQTKLGWRVIIGEVLLLGAVVLITPPVMIYFFPDAGALPIGGVTAIIGYILRSIEEQAILIVAMRRAGLTSEEIKQLIPDMDYVTPIERNDFMDTAEFEVMKELIRCRKKHNDCVDCEKDMPK